MKSRICDFGPFIQRIILGISDLSGFARYWVEICWNINVKGGQVNIGVLVLINLNNK